VSRLRHTLATATRLFGQVPENHLADRLPNRDRTLLGLANHIVEIGAVYLRVESGEAFDTQTADATPAVECDREALRKRSQDVEVTLTGAGATPDRAVLTYFGDSTQHRVLERCTWHAAQHTRQLAMMLERLGIEPDRPLGADDLEGLPLPTAVWDATASRSPREFAARILPAARRR